jgi:hypothetical protein
VGGVGAELAWPPREVKPNGAARPREGEDLGSAVLRVRTELGVVQREIAAVRALPPTASEVKALVRAEIEQKAASGQPRIELAADGKIKLHWPDVLHIITR